MSEDYIARLMAAKALKNGGGEQGEYYSKAEVDEKLSEKADAQDITILQGEISGKIAVSDRAIPDTSSAYNDEPEDDIGILQENEAEQEFPHAKE